MTLYFLPCFSGLCGRWHLGVSKSRLHLEIFLTSKQSTDNEGSSLCLSLHVPDSEILCVFKRILWHRRRIEVWSFKCKTVMGERGALLLINDDYWPPSVEIGDIMLDGFQCKQIICLGEKQFTRGHSKLLVPTTKHQR